MRYTMTLLAAAVLASAGCGTTREAEPVTGAPVPVRTVSAVRREAPDVLDAGGTLRGRSSAVLAARMMAQVDAVLVAPGDRVRVGQPLVRLDARDVAAASAQASAAATAAEQGVARAQGELAAADAAATLARATEARLAALHARRSATPQEFDEAVAARTAAEARLTAARAGVEQARAAQAAAAAGRDAAAATATFAIIAAPFEGVVTEKFVEPGQLAVPGQPLIRVEDVRDLELQIRVDESQVAHVATGARVTTHFVGVDGPITGTGTVIELARASDADARAFVAKVRVPPADGLRPGMYGRAELPLGTRSVLAVPATAVARTGQLASVFAVEEGHVRLRLIRTGRTVGDDVEVLAGLAEGEAVVAAPPPGLRDGARVAGGGR